MKAMHEEESKRLQEELTSRKIMRTELARTKAQVNNMAQGEHDGSDSSGAEATDDDGDVAVGSQGEEESKGTEGDASAPVVVDAASGAAEDAAAAEEDVDVNVVVEAGFQDSEADLILSALDEPAFADPTAESKTKLNSLVRVVLLRCSPRVAQGGTDERWAPLLRDVWGCV